MRNPMARSTAKCPDGRTKRKAARVLDSGRRRSGAVNDVQRGTQDTEFISLTTSSVQLADGVDTARVASKDEAPDDNDKPSNRLNSYVLRARSSRSGCGHPLIALGCGTPNRPRSRARDTRAQATYSTFNAELPIMTYNSTAPVSDYAEKANLDVFLVALADVEIKIQSIDPQAELASQPTTRRCLASQASGDGGLLSAANRVSNLGTRRGLVARGTADRRDRCRKKVVSGFAASWRHRATIELPALNDESE